MRKWARLNSVLLVLGAVGLFGWSLWFGDWEVRLLAVVPLVLAFLDKLVARVPLLKDDVTAFFTRLLSHRATTAVLVLLLVGGMVASQFFGSVMVVSAEPASAGERRVELRRAGEPAEVTTLPGEAEVRWPVATRWWRPREVVVAAAEQEVRVEVLPWHRHEVRLADTFGQPVLLLRPAPRVMDVTLGGPDFHDRPQGETRDVRVEVAHRGESWSAAYSGRSLLVGCPASEICVAPASDGRVDDVLANRTDDLYRRRWLQPQRLDEVELVPGEDLVVEIRVEGQELATWRFPVETGPELQVEELDASW